MMSAGPVSRAHGRLGAMNAQILAELQQSSFNRAGKATSSSYPPERRMSGEVLHNFMTARRYIVVATTRASGLPHIAPSAYLLFGDALWLPTTSGAARLRNVATTPHVSLALTEGEEESHAAVLLDGAADVVAASRAPNELMEMWSERFSSDGDWISQWIVVHPMRLFSYAAPGWRAPSGDQSRRF
jgi:nitroimidazol reductase NimA-like FMN-containing flavoprotein (pyridoxamine 5'-phosphate oxidase superfamily)